MKWMEQTIMYIQEDKRDFFSMFLAMIPNARSSMSKEGARAMNKYYKDTSKAIDSLAPWINRTRRRLISKDKNVESGTVVVQLGPDDDPNSPMFAGAKII